MKFKRTRIAPTPSGYLHLGNILSFALTAYLAQKSGATILLRIDDMDRERVQKEYVQDIFDTLDFLGIPWHEGPQNLKDFETSYSQLQRLNLYNKALQELREQNAVFACSCSRSRLATLNTDGYPGTCRNKQIPLNNSDIAWRLYTEQETLVVRNEAGEEVMTQLPASMKDFVVRKKDGFPAYQLCSVLDDLYWGVDFVVRGKDLWDSTIAQHFLAMKMKKDEFKMISFFHHPLVKSATGLKLSKSAGDTSVHHFRKTGKRPADVFNMIGSILGLEDAVYDWQSLGKAVYGS